MTQTEAREKLKKYNHLVGKTAGPDSIAAIIPLPTDAEMTVEQMIAMIFNNVPHTLWNDYSDFRVVVMLNYQEFHDKGVVIWKDLNDVLALLEIDDFN